MPTDTARGRTAARSFTLRAVACSLGFFGLLRLTWTEAHAVLPLTRVQAGLASGLFGAPALPVEVTLACSGADALALCLGAVLAYPVQWRTPACRRRRRHRTDPRPQHLRIGTLGRAADVARVVQRASPLRLARGAHARDRRICVRVDAPRGSASGSAFAVGFGATRSAFAAGSGATGAATVAHDSSC